MQVKKIIRLIPIILLTVCMIYSFYQFMTDNYVFSLKHKIGMGLLLVNIVVYFFNVKYGIIGTGIYLSIGFFNLMAIFPTIRTFWFTFSPTLQLDYFLFLLLYFCCVGSYLINLYLDHKEKVKS
jgi:hypothetical protein